MNVKTIFGATVLAAACTAGCAATEHATSIASAMPAAMPPSAAEQSPATSAEAIPANSAEARPAASAPAVAPMAPPVSSATAATPALFSKLFERGHSWRYRIRYEHLHWGDTDPNADADGNVRGTRTGVLTCTVGEVRELVGAVASTIACEGFDPMPMGDPTPAGHYAATADGLWRTSEPVFDVDALEPAAMLMASSPEVINREREDADGFGEQLVIVRQADGWCFDMSSWGGDEGGFAMCLSKALGITSGRTFFSGGSVHDSSYRLL